MQISSWFPLEHFSIFKKLQKTGLLLGIIATLRKCKVNIDKKCPATTLMEDRLFVKSAAVSKTHFSV